MSDQLLLKIQALSGGTFLVFTLLHLTNTGIATLGLEEYDAFQGAARTFYQHPVVEIGGLLIPLAIHWTAAIVRLRRDGFRRHNRSLRARLHRYSGYFLLAVIWGHVVATRAPSAFFDVDVGSEAVSFAIAWLPLLFYPYYTVLALCGLYHGVNGMLLSASIFGFRIPDALRYGPGFWLPWATAALFIMLGIAGLSGNLFPIPDPFENPYARYVTELLGQSGP